MVPPPITDDYYMVLEVEQTATLELIVKSYRRLALKLHPDRNSKQNTTEAFQRVCQFSGAKLIFLSIIAFSVRTNIRNQSSDETSRRAYDLTYPYLVRRSPFHPTAQTPCPPSASTSQPGALNEAAQIAALQKSKEERGARWRIKKNAFDSSMFQLQRGIWQLEREIKGLNIIIDAEAAIEAQKNSWKAWLMSPILKKAEDTEEEKARKDRWRQESRIEKDMKERRLALTKADLKREQDLLGKAKEEIDAADLADERKIQMLQAKIRPE